MPGPSQRHHPQGCPQETLFVELAQTCDALSRGVDRVLREAELSAPQYNVLRILRGASDGLLCGQISERMITRDPDITRLLDRLERRRLISRSRESCDRRRILVRIAPAGLTLLRRLDDPMCDLHRRQLGHLPPERIERAIEILRACRSEIP